MKKYSGIQKDQGCGGQTIFVTENGQPHKLPLEPSLAIRGHSPSGFNWGYGGSGPAQTALAILFDFTGDEKMAQAHYQAFKFDIVAGWGPVWQITEGEIETWLSRQNDDLVPA